MISWEEREIKIFVEILATLAAGRVGLSGEDPALPGPDLNILTATGLYHPSDSSHSTSRLTFGFRWNVTNTEWLAMNFGADIYANLTTVAAEVVLFSVLTRKC